MANKVPNKRITIFGRLSYPAIWTPATNKEYPNAPAKYSLNLILDGKKDPEIGKVLSAITEIAQAAWGSRAQDKLKELRRSKYFCLRDGDKRNEDRVNKGMEPGPEYDGNLFFVVKASANKRPLVVDADKTPLTENDGRPYSGCYVRVLAEFYYHKDGIYPELKGVQFVRDGDAFTGATSTTTDDFEDLSGSAGAKEETETADDLW